MSAFTTIKRKNKIIQSYITVAKRLGINSVTRDNVAVYAECCPSLINYYFGSMDNLLNRAAYQAIEDKDKIFILQLFSIRHASVENAVLSWLGE